MDNEDKLGIMKGLILIWMYLIMLYDLLRGCGNVLVGEKFLFVGIIFICLYWIDIKELLIVIVLEVYMCKFWWSVFGG